MKKPKPRGRPWPPGTSGNRKGRPRGSRNKFTEAVIEGFRTITLDITRPLEVRYDVYIQDGRKFCKETLEEINPGGPVPVQSEMLDIQGFYREVLWHGRAYFIQNGWLYDRHNLRAVKV